MIFRGIIKPVISAVCLDWIQCSPYPTMLEKPIPSKEGYNQSTKRLKRELSDEEHTKLDTK